jgi:hypothetical protein
VAMEATMFTGWIYDHLLPHAAAVKVAHPLMLRAIAAAKKKNHRIDTSKICDCLRCDFLPECHMVSAEVRERRRTLRYRKHWSGDHARSIDPFDPPSSGSDGRSSCSVDKAQHYSRTYASATPRRNAMTEQRFRVGIVGLEPGRGWAARAHVPALRALSDSTRPARGYADRAEL